MCVFQSIPTVTEGVGTFGFHRSRGIAMRLYNAGIVKRCGGHRASADQASKLLWPQSEHRVDSV